MIEARLPMADFYAHLTEPALMIGGPSVENQPHTS